MNALEIYADLATLCETTTAAKMSSAHKNGYIDGMMDHPMDTSETDPAKRHDYEAGYKLGQLHCKKLIEKGKHWAQINRTAH